jgi:hypothetical protein
MGMEEGLAMRRHNCHSLLAFGLIRFSLLAIAGCPLAVPVVDDATLGPEPGTYYVDRIDGKLCYYKLADTRDEDAVWVPLNDGDAWYQGPGFYELSEDYEWSWDEARVGSTLDEFLQLYDPLPVVPDAS